MRGRELEQSWRLALGQSLCASLYLRAFICACGCKRHQKADFTNACSPGMKTTLFLRAKDSVFWSEDEHCSHIRIGTTSDVGTEKSLKEKAQVLLPHPATY
jgi:hypothetical protein